MSRFLLGIMLASSGIAAAIAADSASEQKPEIQVKCRGKLRHGVVAVGGETTGTTISFSGLTWELKLPDATRIDFAKNHHRKQVTAIGTLRKVEGTERPTRWVVEVTELAEPDPMTKDDLTTMTVKGTLKKDASNPSKTTCSVVTDSMTWPLDLSREEKLVPLADKLTGRSVELTGQVECSKTKDPHAVIYITKIEAVPSSEAKPLDQASGNLRPAPKH